MRIGFIGLGIMGAPMARNLLRAGHALVVYGRTRARVDALLAAGATAAPSPAALAAEVDAVVTSLPDTPDVEAVYTGEQGVLAGARPGLLAIDTSTIAPEAAQRLADDPHGRPRAGPGDEAREPGDRRRHARRRRRGHRARGARRARSRAGRGGRGRRCSGLVDARQLGTAHAATGLRPRVHGAAAAEGPPARARRRGAPRRAAADDGARPPALRRRGGARRRGARDAGAGDRPRGARRRPGLASTAPGRVGERMLIDTGLVSGDLRDVAARARAAEAMGYDGLWTAEAGHDPYLPCALAATATERVTIGTNIAVAFPRSPLVHAQIAWDLQQASRGRFVLGLGTQVKGHNERRYSTPWTAPGPRLREMVQLIRHIWDVWQNGTRPGFEGRYYRFSLMTPFFSPAPLPWPHIPIYVAGLNPYVCRLAGELCDGFHLHPFHSIKYVRETVLPNLEAGLRKAGRPRSAVALATTAFVITGKDRDAVERAKGPVRQQIAFYASTRTYAGVLAAHGWGEVANRLNEKAAAGDWAGMAALITDEMLDVYAVTGTYDELPDRIRRKYDGVIDRLAFYDLGGRSPAEEAVWRELITACRA